MSNFTEWKAHSITKSAIKDIHETIAQVRASSCVRDSSCQTAMQVCRNEGIIEGLEAFLDYVENMETHNGD